MFPRQFKFTTFSRVFPDQTFQMSDLTRSDVRQADTSDARSEIGVVVRSRIGRVGRPISPDRVESRRQNTSVEWQSDSYCAKAPLLAARLRVCAQSSTAMKADQVDLLTVFAVTDTVGTPRNPDFNFLSCSDILGV